MIGKLFSSLLGNRVHQRLAPGIGMGNTNNLFTQLGMEIPEYAQQSAQSGETVGQAGGRGAGGVVGALAGSTLGNLPGLGGAGTSAAEILGSSTKPGASIFDPDAQGAVGTVLESLGAVRQDTGGAPTGPSDGLLAALAAIESGNNYDARGPQVEKGQYKGERAMGKYQVMPGNLPEWSKAAVGRQVSEQEFMENPELQEQIVSHRMAQIGKKYNNNPADMASVWHSGRPLSQAQGASDGYMSTPDYVSAVMGQMR